MRTLLALLVALPFSLSAQITHTVMVIGSPGGATPVYSPANITIDVGDQVQWVCNEGSHNVYAELDSFPNNPVPFNSAPTAQPSPWTYSFTFDTPGFYNYGCNGGTQQNPHWTTQQGTITVLDPNAVVEVAGWGAVSVFPMPANDLLHVETPGNPVERYEVLSSDGRTVLSFGGSNATRYTIALDALGAGHYLLRLTDMNGRVLVRPFIKS